MNINSVTEEHAYLSKNVKSIQTQLSKLPKEDLLICKNGQYTKWYSTDKHQPRYISKKDKNLVLELAQKKFLTLKLKGFEEEMAAIEMYLRHRNEKDYIAEEIKKHPEYVALWEQAGLLASADDYEWANAAYHTNPLYPEEKVHKNISGVAVRSKSEAGIASALFKHGIAFRYEAELVIGPTLYYPDFTVLHPKKKKLLYWEHYGKMDDPKYAEKVFAKNERYYRAGIIQGQNFITTYETSASPLTELEIEHTIEEYFL